MATNKYIWYKRLPYLAAEILKKMLKSQLWDLNRTIHIVGLNLSVWIIGWPPGTGRFGVCSYFTYGEGNKVNESTWSTGWMNIAFLRTTRLFKIADLWNRRGETRTHYSGYMGSQFTKSYIHNQEEATMSNGDSQKAKKHLKIERGNGL